MTNNEWWLGPMVGLDFETTGVDPFTDRPVQIGLVYSPGRGVYETVMDKIVDPEMDIGEEAASIHGISNAIAKERGESLQGQITMLLTHINGYSDLDDPDFVVPRVVHRIPERHQHNCCRFRLAPVSPSRGIRFYQPN